MNPLLLAPLLEVGKTILDRFVPDAQERQKAEAELLTMAMDGELKQALAQLEINAREAQHPSVWVSGWRPGAGWMGVAALGYQGLGYPLLSWASAIKGWPAPPAIDNDALWAILTGLLGIGGMRSYEKQKGVASK